MQQLGGLRARQVEHYRFSIPDMDTPAPVDLRRILDTIDAELGAGEVLYVHCFGGIGRTGTIVGCHLVRSGMAGRDAIATIAALRREIPNGWRASPETEAQRNLVLSWHESKAR
ncbi:MAG: dual specificity protein phosphatase family protein [Anaerolineales bacterium]|nr:dual specificity protein phosphatase family protein [Anaerolineales bacterium]